jgi:hypothetical protein
MINCQPQGCDKCSHGALGLGEQLDELQELDYLYKQSMCKKWQLSQCSSTETFAFPACLQQLQTQLFRFTSLRIIRFLQELHDGEIEQRDLAVLQPSKE